MTEKRFRIVNHDEFDYELDYIMDNYKRMHISDVCDLLNEQHETIRTLGIAITKILQTIKDDKESHAMIMCVEVLKKLEENGFDLE